MAKAPSGGKQPVVKGNSDRKNQKAFKKHPKVFDAIKRKLVNAK